MKTIITLVCLVFLGVQAFSQDGLYSYDSTLVIPDPFFQDLKGQSEVGFLPGNAFENGTWSKDFTIPGILGGIKATATDGTNLYVGGNFRIAGGIIVNGIVKWDGKNWSPIGEGAENGVSGTVATVEALAYIDGKLFAGGHFTRAGTEEVNGIAYWDGNSWNKLGSDSTNGVRRFLYMEDDTLVQTGYVFELFAHKGKIYTGGWFHLAGNNTTNGIAAWDVQTETWETLDGGFGSIYENDLITAYAFAARGDDIYAGGKFDSAGGVPAANIAKWDGMNWSSLGKVSPYISDLEFDKEGNLYAALFSNPGWDEGASGILKWDGVSWNAIPSPDGYESGVTTIEILDDGIYAGGLFEKDEFGANHAFSRWDGETWHRIDGLKKTQNERLEGYIRTIEMVNGKMYLLGEFTRAGDIYPVNIVEWDYANDAWKLLDDGKAKLGIHDGYITTLEESGNTVYAGGDFVVAGGTLARNIAKWTGESWESLGKGDSNGITGTVYSIIVDNNDVFVGGHFNRAGPEASFHVARWNGSKWSTIGIGVGGVGGAHVRALAKVGDYLYVAGYFSVVGDLEEYELPANSIARFNLTTDRWESLGRGIEYVYGIPGIVYDLEVHGNRIYVGGEFQSADDTHYMNFAVLEGNKWSGMDDTDSIGVEGTVRVVKVIDDKIVIGGILRPDHLGESYGLLTWNGEEWSTVGEQLTVEGREAFVNDIVAYDTGFIAGGLFTMAGDVEVNNIAWFDGGTWHSLGGGIFPGVTNLAALESSLFSVGPVEIFTSEGLSVGFARFDLEIPVVITDEPEILTENTGITNYPNPFRQRTTIGFSMSSPGVVQISVSDKHGREIRSLLQEYRQAGNYTLEFDANNLAGGVYFCRLVTGNHSETRKIVLLR